MKKIIALILVLTFMFLFVSCGDDTETPSGNENTGGSTSGQVGPTNTESTDYKTGEVFIDENGNVNLPITPAN